MLFNTETIRVEKIVFVLLLHFHIHVNAEIYIYMQDTYRRDEQQTQEDFFTKHLPLTLFVRVQKKLFKVCV